MRLRDVGFLLAFSTDLLPLGSLALKQAGVPLELATWCPLLFIFGVVPLLDAIVEHDRRNPNDPAETLQLERDTSFRILTMLVLPLWLATLAWCTWHFVQWPLSLGGVIGWTLSTGVIGGTLAINPAHELIHKPTRLEPIIGGVLLSSVGYHGFKVEHVRGHHLHVATPEDSSSARLGESIYAFVPRALWRNLRNAWRLESARLIQRGKSPWSWRNEMVHWTLLWVVFMALACWLGAISGLLFFITQGLVAAATLEVINYVEHYVLSRREISAGRYERVTHLHSCNSSQRYTNWLLFNLQRHSDHHETARRRYQSLLHHDDSPQLPAGNATMFVLALLPPLWRRVMDPRALAMPS
ncbi:MAG: alkane 1-monooxygenase [Rhodanobacter sp.]